MQFKSFMEALKGNQHKLDKNKNGKLDAHDFKLLQKEEDELEEGSDRVERSDFKTNPSGRKSHREIVFKNGEPETDEEKAKMQREQAELDERSMTDAEMKKREDYVKGMKKNVAGFKAKYGERAKDVMYATATKMAMKEETLDEALDPSEIAGNPKMYDASTVKKAYYHKSTSASDKESLARHLDRHHGNKEWRTVKEEVSLEENHLMDYRRYTQAAKNAKAKGDHDIAKDAEEKAAKSASHYTRMTGKKPTFNEAFINGREYASHGLMHPDHAKMGLHQKTGNTVDFYAHGTGDKITGKVTKNDGKSVHIQADKSSGGKLHKFKVTPHLPKQTNEELQMQEQAPVAPSLVKHRIAVTVSEPDHPMVSKRKEKIQKFVNVTHSDNKEGAQKVGEKFYKKKGFRVHSSHHAGMVNEEAKKEDPPFDGPYTKSPGTVKDKSGAVHTPMSRARDLARQAMKKQMKENFDLDITDEQADSLVEAANPEQLDELSKGTLSSYVKKSSSKQFAAGHKAATADSGTEMKAINKAQKRSQGVAKAVDRLTKEEVVDFDEQGNFMAEKLKFSDFIAKINEQLLEYESDNSGVYRHTKKATYGTAYQGDDDEDEKPKKAPAEKRGRGRPAGSYGGSYKARSAETKAAAAAKAAATKAAKKK